MILDEICFNKSNEVEEWKEEEPIDEFKDSLTDSRYDFKDSIKKEENINLIAEVKKRSPSRGVIRENIDFEDIVEIYDDNSNVNAISFLTDEKYFGGSLQDLKKIKELTDKPILRKDFIIDKYQIYQSRHYGADAILLIARILSNRQMEEYIELANEYSMDCLVEVHNKEDIEKIPDSASVIGINNRDLDTLEVSLENTKNLSKEIKDIAEVTVTESGIKNRDDVIEIEEFADSMLIGTAIMQENRINKKINSLYHPKLKICGITNWKDAKTAAENNTDYLGFIFYNKSPRYIRPEYSKEIIERINKQYNDIDTVGVFVNEDIEIVNNISNDIGLDYVQLHGDEGPEYVQKIYNAVIKAFQIDEDGDAISQIYDYDVDFILLDTFHPEKYGGTGETFNWDILEDLDKKKVFLAGGINAENISQAVKFAPYAIDINSGVEKKPGSKDQEKVKQILRKEYK